MTEDILKSTGVNSAGYGIIPKMAMQDQRLHIIAKAIYAYFTSYSGGGNCCFPSRKKICFDLGISNDTFGKYLKQLTDSGYIKVSQIKENGRFSHNEYILCDTISPCPKISDTEDIVHGEMDTNINSNNINSISNINSNKDNRRARFEPPSLDEVKAYCNERHNDVDPQRFIDYYESNGWKVGRNSMKDWKAAVRTWERNGYGNSQPKKEDEPNPYAFF